MDNRRDWEKCFIVFRPTGSSYTCNPPVTNTDVDYICLKSNTDYDAILALGFKQDGQPNFYTGNDNGGFRSFRRGNENLITTSHKDFFDLFVTATELAKRFNLIRKEDRIALFQAVLYGVAFYNLEGS